MPESILLLLQLMLSFMKVGAFSIGGGYAMIPLIQKELVGNGWLTVLEVTDVIAISEMTPGPFAVNAATFAGTKMAGLPGAIFATIGVVLPSIIITLIVSRYFFGFKDNRIVQNTLWGIRPATTGLILGAAFIIASTAFFDIHTGANFVTMAKAVKNIDWISVGIAAAAFFALRKLKASPVLMVFVCAGLGILFYGVLFPIG
ncbi:chromate transporter [Eubacteriales bacterium OttesenSCG-928-M02]|nr:chromate transporter [Eubacteriales bacterium OttesenSCG-928-M02]